jgi:hypothetical protein
LFVSRTFFFSVRFDLLCALFLFHLQVPLELWREALILCERSIKRAVSLCASSTSQKLFKLCSGAMRDSVVEAAWLNVDRCAGSESFANRFNERSFDFSVRRCSRVD